MDDTKLLELAGRAAGEQYDAANNPLERDDLALRLAVKLRLELAQWKDGVSAQRDDIRLQTIQAFNGGDPYAATRRAITRAAASIGKERT